MIVDENLNDCSEEFIRNYIKDYKKSIFHTWVIGLIVIFLITGLAETKLIIDNNNKNHQITTLSQKLEREEQMLSLEYSIGYWFINQPEQINDSILYVFLKDNNAWYPEILLKQAKIESGNYTSNVYMNTNNLYGMKKVGKRQTTQLNNTYNGYGCYTNWCESVLDRMLWDIFYFKNVKPTKEEYLKAMSIYAETDDYVKRLNL